MASGTSTTVPTAGRPKQPATRAAPAALERLRRPATLDEVTAACRHRYPKATIAAALQASPQIVHARRGLWVAAGCTGLPAEDLRRLAAILDDTADDDGLIDEPQLEARCAGESWAGRLEELVTLLGCVRVQRVLCRNNTARAAVKAAMVHLGVRTTPAAVAEATGRPVASITGAMSASPDILPEGDGTWALAPAGYREFVVALRRHRGCGGLVAQDSLAAALGCRGWTEPLEALALKAGCVRLFGRLFENDYPVTLIYGTLLDLKGVATADEIAARLSPELPARYRMNARQVDSRSRGHRRLLERCRDGRWRIAPDARRELSGVLGVSSSLTLIACEAHHNLARTGEALRRSTARRLRRVVAAIQKRPAMSRIPSQMWLHDGVMTLIPERGAAADDGSKWHGSVTEPGIGESSVACVYTVNGSSGWAAALVSAHQPTSCDAAGTGNIGVAQTMWACEIVLDRIDTHGLVPADGDLFDVCVGCTAVSASPRSASPEMWASHRARHTPDLACAA